MNIIISGISGFMGAEVYKLTKAHYKDMNTVAGVDPNPSCMASNDNIPAASSFSELNTMNIDTAECIVDFSHHSATSDLTKYAIDKKLPLIIATTGQTEEELNMIKSAAEQIPVFFAANYSLGIALLIELAKKTAAAMPDAEIEIIEKHHDRKLDAPSGTALTIAKAIQEIRPAATINTGRSGSGKRTFEEIGIHAIRMGNIVGEHEVIVGTQNQTITLKHEAHNRALFAEGALTAASFINGKGPGLYKMTDLLAEN